MACFDACFYATLISPDKPVDPENQNQARGSISLKPTHKFLRQLFEIEQVKTNIYKRKNPRLYVNRKA